MDINKEIVGNRIRSARKKLKLSQKELSERSGLPLPSLKDYETGKRMPGGEAIASLCQAGISANWLLTGKGEMLRSSEQPPAPEQPLQIPGGEAIDDNYVLVPLYDVRAAAGHGAVVENEQVIDYLAFNRKWLWQELHASTQDLYLIEVDGESMEPTLRPGDVILIDRRSAQKVPRDGIYVMRMDDGLLVKRLQRLPGRRVKVTSDNPAYEPFELTLDASGDDFAIIGRVVWAGRRM